MGSHVFISYSREDLRYVQALVEHLTAAGVQVWLDKEIATGARWDTEIKEMIDTAVAVIVVMSPTADKSGWVTNEIHYAIEIQKPILPLLLDGKPFFTLTRIHCEDVTGGRMPGQSFLNTLLALRQTVPPSPPPVKKSGLAQRLSRPVVVAVAASIVVLLVVVTVVLQPWRENQPNQQTEETGSGGSVPVFRTSGAAVESIAFKPDGSVLATGGGNDHTVRLWNPETGELIRPLVGEGITTAIAFSPDGSIIVSSGDLSMWNPSTGEKVGMLEGGGWGVAFSPDSETLAVGDSFNTVTLWAADTGRLVNTLALTNDQGTVVECVAFSGDGQLLTAGGHEGTVKLWNPRTGDHVRTITNDGGAYWMSFSPDGTLFVGNNDGPVRSWDTRTGAQIGTLAEATRAALSPDGTLLATVGKSDYSVRLWDSRTGELVETFAGHANTVQALAFSSDGRVLASGSDDQTVRLWRID